MPGDYKTAHSYLAAEVRAQLTELELQQQLASQLQQSQVRVAQTTAEHGLGDCPGDSDSLSAGRPVRLKRVDPAIRRGAEARGRCLEDRQRAVLSTGEALTARLRC